MAVPFQSYLFHPHRGAGGYVGASRMSVQNVPPPFAVTLCYSKINKCDQERFAEPGVVVAGPEQAALLTIVIRCWTNVSHHCSTHTASSTRLLNQ